MKSLYRAKIFHKRHWPRSNEFTYYGFYLKFSIEEMSNLRSMLFSVNSFNLFSFYEKDHGKRDGSCLKTWALNELKKAGIENFNGEIILQTFPRILGYVFNPVSFWYFKEKDEVKYIMCEVNNTFGESHNYILKDNPSEKTICLSKKFHVSPFYDREGEYRFNFTREDKAFINYFIDNKIALNTYIFGEPLELNDLNIFKLFFKFPFFTIMVVLLIHFQALKLVFKKIKYYRKPKQFELKTTFEELM